MKTTRTALSAAIIVAISTFFSSTATSQSSEDALRFSSAGLGVGSRAIGMGGAYIGVADDYSAVYWNPAGLAQMRRLEFTGGIANSNYSNSANFLSTNTHAKNSGTAVDDLGFVFPFPTVRGSLVFALGYNRVNDFTTALSFNGLNPRSSIIQSFDTTYDRFDLPFQTYLRNSNGYTPITGNVNQQGDVREDGGVGDWAFSGAIDVEQNLSFGLTINVLSGTYNYVRNYVEVDSRGLYQNVQSNLPSDSLYLRFNKFYLDNTITSQLSGVNAMFGVMYRNEDIWRVGFTIKTPSSITIHETYTDKGQSVFDDGSGVKASDDAYNDYGVTTPWVFGFGGSYSPFQGLLLAASGDYTDWTETQWSENADLQQDNIAMKKLFRAVLNYSVGGEFQIPKTDLRLRAGYAVKPSPYMGDPSSFDQKIVTAGAGVLLQDNIMFDVAAAFGSAKTFHNNYGSASENLSRTDESISTTHVDFTVSYRF